MVKANSKSQLQALVASVPLEVFLDYRQYVEAAYQAIKAQTKPYSYVRFAEELHFGTTNKMWLVVNGKRHLSPSSARQFAERLGLTGMRRKYFLALYDYSKERDSDRRAAIFDKMVEYRNRMAASTDAPAGHTPAVSYHEYFSEWFYPVIRELTSLPQFEPDPEWIRQNLRFPLHLTELKKVLSMMCELGFVTYDEVNDRYTRTRQTVKSTLQADQHTLILYQQKMMDIAKESLTRVDRKDREVSCITASIRKSQFAKFQKKLIKLLDEFEAADDPDHADCVYQLNVQLFPFTK